MTWQDVLSVCVAVCLWSGPRKEWDESLIEPLLYQSKYKVNIDLSGLGKGEWTEARAKVQKEKCCQLSGHK